MSFIRSVTTLGGWTLVSRLVGFLRDVCIAKFLGASLAADAFFVALRFPNLFRSFFAEGSLNVSFIPIFTGIFHEKGKKEALLFSKKVFALLFYTLLFLVLFVEIFMPFAMSLLAPGFSSIPGKLEFTTLLSRITFPFLMMISLVSLYSCILNSLGKFAAPAFTPTLMNLIMIGALFLLNPFLNSPALALSWGVFFAGIVQFLFLTYFVRKEGLVMTLSSPKETFSKKDSDVKLLLKRMIPGIFGSGIYQINLFFDVFLVSFLGAGAVSWLNYAHRLFQLPVGIIGVSIGTALLPLISRHIKTHENQKAYYQINRGLELALMMSLGAMFGLITLSTPIIRLLFQRGAFSFETTLHTAAALEAYAIGLPAYMLTKTLMPFFYAKGDTKTPVKIATVGLVLNIVFSLLLIPVLNYRGIALATGISTWVNLGQYIYLLKKEGEFHLDLLFKKRALRIVFSSLLMAGVLILTERLCLQNVVSWNEIKGLSLLIKVSSLIFIGGLTFVSSLFISKALSLKEIKLLFKR
ncbi:MAG: murein biosynthesis integral membrane protein MurJ [Alphaproteobacteria bacterium]|nr:murein biosynthesis integral membrane protein MurJ [Alphaproteobacteria bacterium]